MIIVIPHNMHIHCRSIDHPDYPVGRKYTRVNQYFSEMVIKPDSFIDEPGFDYELTYLDNPQISLPSSVVNWVTTTGMYKQCSHRPASPNATSYVISLSLSFPALSIPSTLPSTSMYPFLSPRSNA